MDESVDTVKMVLKSDTGDSVTVCMYPDNAFEEFSNKFHNHLDLPLDCQLKVEDSHFLTKEKDSELLFGDLGLISSVSDVTDVTFVSTDPETLSITSDNNFVMSPVQQSVYPQDVRSCMKPEVSYDSCSPVWSKVVSFRCAVPTCVNTKDTWPRKKFFKFPIAKDRCHQWLQLCRREDLLEEPSEMVGSLYVVCSDHFIQDHFVTVARKALTKMAVPTIFPAPDDILTKQSVNTKELENESIHSDEKDEDDIVDDDVFYVCDSDTEDLGELTGLQKSYLEKSSSSSDSERDVDSPGQLCRLCGCVSEDAAYIYGSTEEDLGLASKINTLLPIIVEKSDPLPKQVCMNCLSKLETCFELTKSCLRTDRWLNRLKRKNFFRSHTLMKVHPREVSQKSSNGFIKLEVTNSTSLCEQTRDDSSTNDSTDVKRKYDENNFDNSAIEKLVTSCYSCPFCSDGTMIMQKTSSHDSTLVCGDIKTTEQSINSCALPNDKSAKQMLNDESVSTSDTELHPELPNVFYEVRDEHGNKYAMVEPTPSWWNEDGNMGNTEIIIHAVNPNKLSEEPWPTLNHAGESVDRHRCLLCGTSFQTLEMCLEHSNSHPDTEGFVCNVCLLHFSNKSELASHMEDHRADEKRLFRVEGSKRLICTVCGRKFNNERTWKAHSCAVSEPSKKLFKCTECNKSFLTEERLTFHGILHKLKQPNHCEKCDRQFEHRSAFYQHWRLVHEGERPFCCHKCGKTFYSHSRLVTHLRTHSGERPYECDVCHHKFYDKETLKGHYVTHMNTKPFQCHLCGAFCGRRSLFNQHLKVHHSGPNGPKRAPSLIHYFCKSCNKTFTSSNEVLTHRATHWHREEKDKNREDNPVTHDCEYCGKGYLSIAELAKHRKLEHAEEKPYVCSICGELTKTLYEARAHRKSHTTVSSVSEESGGNMKEGDKCTSLVCEECGAQCVGSRKLKAHLKLHRAETVYQCGMCCRNFPNHRRLILHQRMHSGEKPYPCPDCGKRFSQTSALHTHSLLHTGEKPHICDLCDATFRIKADRDNHRRTHTGERPYRCEYCSKQFRTGQVYYQHRMIHTGERRFPCNVCGKAFKRSHTLVVHKRIHTGEKPNICDVCGKGFRQRTDMRKHRALHGS